MSPTHQTLNSTQLTPTPARCTREATHYVTINFAPPNSLGFFDSPSLHKQEGKFTNSRRAGWLLCTEQSRFRQINLNNKTRRNIDENDNDDNAFNIIHIS